MRTYNANHAGADMFVSLVMMMSNAAQKVVTFFIKLRHRYKPERHYMRGPGPACAQKRSLRTR